MKFATVNPASVAPSTLNPARRRRDTPHVGILREIQIEIEKEKTNPFVV